MGSALSSERVYLSLLGRSAWALLNTYYAVECKIWVEHYRIITSRDLHVPKRSTNNQEFFCNSDKPITKSSV